MVDLRDQSRTLAPSTTTMAPPDLIRIESGRRETLGCKSETLDLMTSSNRIPAQGKKMANPRRKTDLPVSEIRRYLEPGPIVLVTSAHGDERNIMTMGWHTVMEFTPSLV
jgi:hypothetical protein